MPLTQRADAIRSVIQASHDSKATFVVCGGVDAEGNLHGRDVDILTGKNSAARLCQIAEERLAEMGYLTWRRQNVSALLLFFRKKEDDAAPFFEIDFLHTLQWTLTPFVSGASSLGDVRTINDVPASPWASFAKNILIQLLAGNKPKVAAKLRDAQSWLANSPEISRKLEFFVGSSLAAELQQAVQHQDLAGLWNLAPALRRSCLARSLRPGHWPGLPSAALRWLRQSWHRYFGGRPLVPILAVVGPDGAGKSSVLAAVAEKLPERFPFWGVAHRHWRPELLPNIGALAGKPQPEKGQPVVPRRTRGRFYFIRLAYYASDFLLGYFFKDRPARSGLTPVLYDRCFWDMYVDPLRFGLGGTRGMIALGRILPRPDLIVCLEVDPHTARERKGELNDAEVTRQNNAWRDLAATIRTPLHRLDAREPVKTNAENIVALYMDALGQMLGQSHTTEAAGR
jgi:thymidylate kinase